YNKAWDKNLGFVPMSDEEFAYVAKDLKMVVDPKYCILAEKENEIVGFAAGIPNINEVLIKIKRGRLFPFGIFKLLFGRKKIKHVRVMMFGVVAGYHKAAAVACLYGSIINHAQASGIQRAECSGMLDRNYMASQAIGEINGEL